VLRSPIEPATRILPFKVWEGSRTGIGAYGEVRPTPIVHIKALLRKIRRRSL